MIWWMVLAACTSDPAVAPPEDPGPAAVPVAWTEHYSAVSTGLWMGTSPFEESYLVRRFVDPTAGQIREEFRDQADGSVLEVLLQIDADAATFTLEYLDGSYSGTGTLSGEAWAWESWESTSHAADGSRVESTDTQDEGGIVAQKTGFSAAGDPEWTLDEVLSPLTEEEWETASAALD